MAVEGHVAKLEFLFVAVLVNEGGFEGAFASGMEGIDLDLLREIYPVLGDFLIHGFLGAPVDGQLLVAAFVVQIFDFLFTEGLLFHGGEVAVQALAVDAHIVAVVQNHGHVLVGVGDADVNCIVLDVGFAVIVVGEVHLLFEHCVQKSPHRQFLLAERFAF